MNHLDALKPEYRQFYEELIHRYLISEEDLMSIKYYMKSDMYASIREGVHELKICEEMMKNTEETSEPDFSIILEYKKINIIRKLRLHMDYIIRNI